MRLRIRKDRVREDVCEKGLLWNCMWLLQFRGCIPRGNTGKVGSFRARRFSSCCIFYLLAVKQSCGKKNMWSYELIGGNRSSRCGHSAAVLQEMSYLTENATLFIFTFFNTNLFFLCFRTDQVTEAANCLQEASSIFPMSHHIIFMVSAVYDR